MHIALLITSKCTPITPKCYKWMFFFFSVKSLYSDNFCTHLLVNPLPPKCHRQWDKIKTKKKKKLTKKTRLVYQHLKLSHSFTSLISLSTSSPTELEENGFGQVWTRWQRVVKGGWTWWREKKGGGHMEKGILDNENHIHFHGGKP